MKYLYKLRTDTIYNESKPPIIVYGVDCLADGKIVLSVEDIFFDLQKAKEFVNLCNSVNLSLAYLETLAQNAVENQSCTV